ncbi:MAG: FtsX-like permease family protein [Rikenellaceae bacterium]|nr:FtsX-like permease family protein [Rikenellaceae bacterium]
MKIAFQNFLTTLKRYKTASILNVAGLTIAFIAFYILMAQVHYGLTFNRPIPDNDRVYISIAPDNMTEFYRLGVAQNITVQTIEQIPEVEAGGLYCPNSFWNEFYTFDDGQYKRYEFELHSISIPLLEALSVEMIAGDEEQLNRPGTVIISDVAARKMKVGAGDMLYYSNHPEKSQNSWAEVVGVFKAFDDNTLFSGAHVLEKILPQRNAKYAIFDTTYAGVIKLREGADIKKFEDQWIKNYTEAYKASSGAAAIVAEQPVHFIKLSDYFLSPYKVKYDSNTRAKDPGQGTPTVLYSQMAVAILTVLIAFINFVNFFFALIPVRIRAVNISKVFGATNRSLRWSFLFEALALTLISLAIALYLMIAIQDSFISDFVDCSLALKDNLVTIGWILLIVVALALTAALYPAWYITSFAPSLAIKGRFGGSKAGQQLRIVLSFVQFSISMSLIIVTLAFWLQYRYMAKYDMGFDYENVVKFNLNYSQAVNHVETIREEILRNPMIEDVTATKTDIFRTSAKTTFRADNGDLVEVEMMEVRYNFLKFFRIPVEGQDFTTFAAPGTRWEEGQFVVSSELKNTVNNNYAMLNRAIGTISGCRFRSINRPYMCYEIISETEDAPMGHIYMRLHPKADYKQVREYVNKVVEPFSSGNDDITFARVEDQIADMYAETRKQTVLLSLFAFTSIIISLMGVFGIVIFETQYRRKEIAIRRVFGATTSGLLWMFNSRYVEIVGACFLLSVPVAYYIIHEWQKSFVYKAPIGWWVYVAALVVILLLTLLLVTYRSWRAANENPADVVKSE